MNDDFHGMYSRSLVTESEGTQVVHQTHQHSVIGRTAMLELVQLGRLQEGLGHRADAALLTFVEVWELLTTVGTSDLGQQVVAARLTERGVAAVGDVDLLGLDAPDAQVTLRHVFPPYCQGTTLLFYHQLPPHARRHYPGTEPLRGRLRFLSELRKFLAKGSGGSFKEIDVSVFTDRRA